MNLEEQLCFALYSATNSVIRTYRPWLRDIGLTYPQYLVLLVLWQNGERTMGEIATRLALPPGGVTPIVERLEAADLVVRRRDEADRRVVHVMLTESGARLEAAGSEAQRRVSCATLMGDDELADLRAVLHRLTQQLSHPEETESVASELVSALPRSGPQPSHLPGDQQPEQADSRASQYVR